MDNTVFRRNLLPCYNQISPYPSFTFPRLNDLAYYPVQQAGIYQWKPFFDSIKYTSPSSFMVQAGDVYYRNPSDKSIGLILVAILLLYTMDLLFVRPTKSRYP